MKNTRNIYLYLVNLISLQVVSWATLFLIQNLFDPKRSKETVAMQIALLVVATPICIGHWIWSTRLIKRSESERHSLWRRLFFYFTFTLFLSALIFYTYSLFQAVFFLLLGTGENSYLSISPGRQLFNALLAGGLFSSLVYYYRTQLQIDLSSYKTAEQQFMRHLFLWMFQGISLIIGSWGVIALLHRLITILLTEQTRPAFGIESDAARALAGIIPWLISSYFLYRQDEKETNNLLGTIFRNGVHLFTLIIALVNGAVLLGSFIQQMMGIELHGNVANFLAPLLLATAVWLYYRLLQNEAETKADTPLARQGMQQIHQYLTAAVGFALLVVGLGWLISYLIRLAYGPSYYTRDEVGWYLALILLGLPFWLKVWLLINARVNNSDETGLTESRSLPRAIYLYLFLFVAAMVILSSGVYTVFRIITGLMGLPSSYQNGIDLVHAFTFASIAVAVWSYHIFLLRLDQKRATTEKSSRYAQFSLALLATQNSRLQSRLAEELPGLHIHTASTTDPVDLLILPASALLSSTPSRTAKETLILPEKIDGYRWIGQESLSSEQIIEETVDAVQQILDSQTLQTRRRFSFPLIFAIIVSSCIFFSFLSSVLSLIFTGF